MKAETVNEEQLEAAIAEAAAHLWALEQEVAFLREGYDAERGKWRNSHLEWLYLPDP